MCNTDGLQEFLLLLLLMDVVAYTSISKCGGATRKQQYMQSNVEAEDDQLDGNEIESLYQ